jgi:hypothetical protein
MLTSNIKTLPPHMHVIAIDETELVSKEWLHEVIQRHGLKVESFLRYEGLYLYDSSVQHHLCSFESNYWLQWYDGRFIFADDAMPDGELMPDALQDELDSEKYLWQEDVYMSCDTIDDLVQQIQVKQGQFEYRDLGTDEKLWQECLTMQERSPDELDGNGYPCGSYDAYLAAQLEGVQSNAPM